MLMNQVMTHLGISHNGVLALVRLRLLDPNQVVPFAPWRVGCERLDSEEVQRAVAQLKKTGRLPKGDPQSSSKVSSTQINELPPN